MTSKKEQEGIVRNIIKLIAQNKKTTDSKKIIYFRLLLDLDNLNQRAVGVLNSRINRIEIRVLKARFSDIKKNKRFDDAKKIMKIKQILMKEQENSDLLDAKRKVISELHTQLTVFRIESIIKNEMYDKEEILYFLEEIQDELDFESENWFLVKRAIDALAEKKEVLEFA